MLNFSIKRINGMLLSSNIQPEPMFTNLRLVKGNYALYPAAEIPFKHPQKNLLSEARSLQSCNGNIYVSGITPESLPPLPKVIWPTREKGSFPRHWHIRRVYIYHENSGKIPTPLEIEQGSFFIFESLETLVETPNTQPITTIL
jgi:hypothetical protein